MPSCYKVIKDNLVVSGGEKKIEIVTMPPQKDIIEENDDIQTSYDEELYELAENILAKARREAQKIISESYMKAKEIEEEAFKKASEEGYNAGYEKGYNEAMESALKEASENYEKLTAMGEEYIYNCKKDYEKYMIDKKDEIKKFIYSATYAIINKEIKNEDFLNELMEKALNTVKSENAFILKVNSNYLNALKDAVEEFKQRNPYLNEIFILEDKTMEDGVGVIQWEGGKIIINPNDALEELQKLILSEE